MSLEQRCIPKEVKTHATAVLLLLCLVVPALAKGPPAADVNIVGNKIERIAIADRIAIDAPIQSVSESVYTVPEGKRLVLDYVSYLLDVVVIVNPPATEVEAMLARIGNFSTGLHILGPMDRIELSTRGTPNFFIGKSVPVSFGPGEQIIVSVSPRNANINMDFGALDYAISAQLLDE